MWRNRRVVRAQVGIAQDQLSYASLFADAPASSSDEPGEVVRAGQTIVNVARQGGRDAVFDVSEQLLRTGPLDPVVQIALTNDPSVQATGRVREVSPQADPATRTFQVKVGIIDPPPAMELGSTVSGSIKLVAPPGVQIPASALTEANGRPAVWVVDRQSETVSLRTVDVSRYGVRRTSAFSRVWTRRRSSVTRRRADAASGPEGPPPRSRAMMRFNLSRVASAPVTHLLFHARHRGRWRLVLPPPRAKRGPRLHSEDRGGPFRPVPPSPTRSSRSQTASKASCRRRQPRFPKSYTSAGQTTIFVNLKDSSHPSQVPDIWYQVRKKVRDIADTLPQGVEGPAFNDEFGDTYGGTASRRTVSRAGGSGAQRVDVRKSLLRLPDISTPVREILGAQDERVYVEFWRSN